jgi:hypothetical protein
MVKKHEKERWTSSYYCILYYECTCTYRYM